MALLQFQNQFDFWPYTSLGDQKRRSKIPKKYDTEISLSAAWKVGGKKQMRGTGTIVLLRSTITNEDMSIWKANRNFIFVGEMRI